MSTSQKELSGVFKNTQENRNITNTFLLQKKRNQKINCHIENTNILRQQITKVRLSQSQLSKRTLESLYLVSTQKRVWVSEERVCSDPERKAKQTQSDL